jgi:hypothetical protein
MERSAHVNNWLKVMMVLGLGLFLPLAAQDEFEDEFSEFASEPKGGAVSQPLGFEFTGMVELEQGGSVTSDGPRHADGMTDRDWMMANRRLRLQTMKVGEKGGLYAKVDFLQDDISDETVVDIRELRLVYTPARWLDISLGKQVSTWGVADMLFINDLFPKNWNANFLGRDMEYLKDTAVSARFTSYFKGWTHDLVYTPQFTQDTTPNGCYLNVFDPNSGQILLNPQACGTEQMVGGRESKDVDDGEWAMQLKRDISGQQVALYYYHGFFKNPKSLQGSGIPEDPFRPYYSALSVYGASTEGQVGPGIFTAETGYYDSKEDPDGDHPMIENSKIKFLLGYKMDLDANWTVGLQYYTERFQDHDAYLQSVSFDPTPKKEQMDTFTLRVMFKAQQETLFVNLFSYIRPDDHDSFTKLDLSKRLNDHFSVVVGINYFTGKVGYEDREFSMLDEEDNAFVRIRYNL